MTGITINYYSVCVRRVGVSYNATPTNNPLEFAQNFKLEKDCVVNNNTRERALVSLHCELSKARARTCFALENHNDKTMGLKIVNLSRRKIKSSSKC